LLPILQQCAEIGVGGNNNAALLASAVEDDTIVRRLHSVIPDVHGIMTGQAQAFRKQRR
jgi:hypothetical protein